MLCGLRIPGAGADRRPERHDRGGTELLQPQGQHGIIVRISEHFEAPVHQLFRGVDKLDGVRQQGLFVGDDLQLDPVSLEVRGPVPLS